ncbi:MAG: hypothetical protein KKE39_00240 [Bacteroidetes bacterium]|nr:hypothetical protein [Bacteroidota bacterium]MBU1372475.1 hypothetical protein [Bacteroidota bacterium]MBU1485116.1 hypothetical protein [Bacteroidota bacterium]MBU1762063.1 hypothetical protein [Bacteroidota bacterium]MBU2268284.1 hypothetical protein [Bacteroidota bacterium]
MARVKNNVITQNLSGAINRQLVFKTYASGTVVTKFPDMSKVKLTEKQKAQNTRFKNAVSFAKEVLADPEKKAAMLQRTPSGKLVYHQAIAEYLASN